MFYQFAQHVIGMRNNRVVTVQVFLSLCLQPVELKHRDGTQAAAAMWKVVRETGWSKAPLTRLYNGKLESLGSADAGSIVVVSKKYGRCDPLHLPLELRIR